MGAANDPTTLPCRIPTPTVLELAGYKRGTLRRRQAAALMPQPIDRGTGGGIYDLDAVLKALGIASNEPAEQKDPWDFDDDAYERAAARKVRRPQSSR